MIEEMAVTAKADGCYRNRWVVLRIVGVKISGARERNRIEEIKGKEREEK